jgi:hypothetical protein
MERTEPRPPWTPPRVRTVLLVLALIVVLNAFDVCATLIVVSVVGAAEEMNPLMRWALNAGPATFTLVKMGMIVGFSSGLAWLALRRQLAWRGLCGLAALYAGLVAYQFAVFCIAPPPGFR